MFRQTLLEPNGGEDDPDRAALGSRQRHVAGQQHLVVARHDPQVNVRRTALVRHRAWALEAEAADTVGEDRRAAGARVLAAPVRLPELNLSSGDRAAIDGEHDTRQDMALSDRGPAWGRTSAERPSPIGQRGSTPLRGRSRGSGTRDDEHEQPKRQADCGEPSHGSRSTRCGAWRLGGFGGMSLVVGVRCSFRGKDAGSADSGCYRCDRGAASG